MLRTRISVDGMIGSETTMNTTWTILVAALIGQSLADAAEQPNIVFIMADDLGWKDVGYMRGASLRRPTSIDLRHRE
jgi:hypothetical protein